MYLAEALTTMRPIVLDEEENKLRLHLVTGAAVKQGGDEVNDLLVVEVENEIVLSMISLFGAYFNPLCFFGFVFWGVICF